MNNNYKPDFELILEALKGYRDVVSRDILAGKKRKQELKRIHKAIDKFSLIVSK